MEIYPPAPGVRSLLPPLIIELIPKNYRGMEFNNRVVFLAALIGSFSTFNAGGQKVGRVWDFMEGPYILTLNAENRETDP